MKDLLPSEPSALQQEEILAQVQALLNSPDDLHQSLLKDMLLSLLHLRNAHLDTLDLKIVNRTIKELCHGFSMFQEYRSRPKVTAFGSARTLPQDPNYLLAVQFARRVVEAGYMVITGGADGIMKACQEGAGRDQSFGINIMLPFEQGPNTIIANDPKLINLKYFFTRKLMFVKESKAIALFPGGFGTHDEGFEVLTLTQTGKGSPQPIICLQDPDCNYWDQWMAFIKDQLLSRKLVDPEDLSLFTICTSEDAAVQEIQTFYRTYHSMRFVGQTMVMRLTHPISPEQLDGINSTFSDLLIEGSFDQGLALPEEFDEPAIRNLPRLVFLYNRRSAGRLRQLIDHLNLLPFPPPTPTPGSVRVPLSPE